jgi:hypothetical protein
MTWKSADAPSWRRRAASVAGLAVVTTVGATLLADPFASAQGTVTITPHVIENNVSVSAGHTVAAVVSGGATTVPTDATRVQLLLTVSREQHAGSVRVWPNPVGTSPDSLEFAANTAVSGVLTEAVGTQNKVVFENLSAGTITLKVEVTGYSTEVRADDISPQGGTTGQVLTNTGTGVAWGPGPADTVYADAGDYRPLTTALMTVATVTVPAGTYLATAMVDIDALSTGTTAVGCELDAPPTGNRLDSRWIDLAAPVSTMSASMQSLYRTASQATILLRCYAAVGSSGIQADSLIVSQVGSALGVVR